MPPFIRKLIGVMLPPLLAIALSFLVGAGFILAVGKDPLLIFGKFFSGSLGNFYGIGQVVFDATPLIFTGLSAALCFRAGLFNIGAEGQSVIGAFAMAWVGFTFSGLPAIVLLPACILAGIVGGGIWGAIPGVLKAKFGAHEVINTMMMNFIAAALVSYLVNHLYAMPATVHTPPIGNGGTLPRLGVFSDLFKGSPANLTILLALAACLFVNYLLWRTRFGYEVRTVGLNVSAARYAGIDVERKSIAVMAAAGGIAGLAGCNFVLGYKHYFELGFSENTGFIGIAVALLAENNPVGIIFSALLFGLLSYGGLTVNSLVPKELVNILQGLIILFVITFTKLFDRWLAGAWLPAATSREAANV